eukprot:5937288-Amphidinium_carterae.1
MCWTRSLVVLPVALREITNKFFPLVVRNHLENKNVSCCSAASTPCHSIGKTWQFLCGLSLG